MDDFAKAFRDEKHLRETLETLFSKISGVTFIRRGHSVQEVGKDLLFYEKTPIDRRLVACVVKHTKITGSAGESKGARTVLIQVQQALDTPYINEKGAEEFVEHVYVISPHDCLPETMNSIRGAMRLRYGQAYFLCGRRLYDLFREYWPDFLQSKETSITEGIGSTVRDLEIDNAASSALFRFGFPIEAKTTLRSSYIVPAFSRFLFEFIAAQPWNVQVLQKPLTKGQLRVELGRLVAWSALFGSPGAWEENDAPSEMERAKRKIPRISVDVEGAWSESARQTHIDPGNSSTNAVTITELSGILNKYRNELSKLDSLQQTVQGLVQDANRCAMANHRDLEQLLADPLYSSYSRTLEIWYSLPKLVSSVRELGQVSSMELPGHKGRPLLITAAPGYGKTSFCKWHALKDTELILASDRNAIPVYIPLHKAAKREGDFEEVFLSDSPLVAACRSEKWNRPLKIYADGLDEVPSIERQRELMLMLKTAVDETSQMDVVVTAREHVSGPWLGWLTRLSLRAFSEEQVRELAAKWLDYDETSLHAFMRAVSETPALRDLVRIPLLCTLSVAVFKKIHGLPPSQTALYDMFISLLAGGWDTAKELVRPSNFSAQTKIKAISELAGILHRARRVDCDESDVRTALADVPGGRPAAAPEFLAEAVADGILVPAGNAYTFAHLSFQEFLTARQLHDPTGSRPAQAIGLFLSGDDWWREVSKFYVTMTSSIPETERWIEDLVQENGGRERAMELKAALWWMTYPGASS